MKASFVSIEKKRLIEEMQSKIKLVSNKSKRENRRMVISWLIEIKKNSSVLPARR